MRKISFILANDGTLNAVANGKSYTVRADHVNYAQIKEAIKADDADTLDRLADVKTAVETFTGNKVEVKNGVIFYMGQELHNVLTDKILQVMREGFPFEPMLKFLENLMENSSMRAVQELYGFLSNEALPITEDGCFLAYKRVKDDWKDIYSGKLDNSIGKVVEVPRNTVDEDKNRGCSYGLHVGSIKYVSSYCSGGHVIIVKVNPKDAVSVPAEDCGKMRVCKYEVLEEYKGKLTSAVYSSDGGPYVPPNDDFDGEEGDYDDEDYDEDFDSDLDSDLDEEDEEEEEEALPDLVLPTNPVNFAVPTEQPVAVIVEPLEGHTDQEVMALLLTLQATQVSAPAPGFISANLLASKFPEVEKVAAIHKKVRKQPPGMTAGN